MSDVLELTEFEQLIYNTHLKVSRLQKKLPFKYRKDFTSLDDVTRKNLKKIAIFLNNFKQIKLDDFLIAPYEIYKDESYFDLSYYTTLKATKAYTIYQNNKINEDIDGEKQLSYIAQSLIFIQTFCIDNNLTLDNYLTHKTEKIPSFILHLQEHKVNIFTLLGFTDFTKQLSKNEPELIKFILGEMLYNSIPKLKVKFLGSTKAFPLVTTGLQRIQKKLFNLS
jgi:hypothetical protein